MLLAHIIVATDPHPCSPESNGLDLPGDIDVGVNIGLHKEVAKIEHNQQSEIPPILHLTLMELISLLSRQSALDQKLSWLTLQHRDAGYQQERGDCSPPSL